MKWGKWRDALNLPRYVLCTTVIIVVGCSDNGSDLEVGESYENVFGTTRLTVRGGGEIDVYLGETNSSYGGTYSIIEEDRIRVAATILGSSVVKTYVPIEEGLRDLSAPLDITGILFSSRNLEDGRCRHLSEAFPNIVNDALARARLANQFTWQSFAEVSILPRGGTRAFKHERIQAGSRHAFKIQREGCGKYLIWDSDGIEKGLLLSADDAEEYWSDLAKKFEEHLASIEAASRLAAAKAEEARQEALRKRQILIDKSKKSENFDRFVVKSGLGDKEHLVIVSDAGLWGIAWVNGWLLTTDNATGDTADFYWFCHVSNQPVAEEAGWKSGEMLARMKFLQPAWDHAFEFESEDERARFAKTATNAISAWHAKYSELVSSKACDKPRRYQQSERSELWKKRS